MIRARLVVLPLLLLVLSVCAAAQDPSLPAADGAISLATFVEELDRVIVAIDAAATPAAASELASTIPARWRVRTHNETVDVSGRWLTLPLADAAKRPTDWPTVRAEIRRRVDAVREEARARDAADATDVRTNARGAIGGILGRDQFQQSATSKWRDRLRERVAQWFDDLWSRFGGGPGTGRRVAIVLAWAAGIAALVGLGFWLARSIAERPRGPALNLAAGGGMRPRARELALRAIAEARNGNPREAVRCGYNAALIQLEEDGAWRVDDARTPREYLPMLRPADARRPPMLDLTQRFEQIWYGNRAISAEDTPRVTAHLETLGCLRPGERVI